MLAEMVVGVVVVLQNDRKMKKRDREGDGVKGKREIITHMFHKNGCFFVSIIIYLWP